MYTVYGLYINNEDAPVYIGATKQPLHIRFTSHLNTKDNTTNPVVLHRQEMFRKHRSGEQPITIKAISTHATRGKMLDEERRLTLKIRPILNYRNAGTAIVSHPQSSRCKRIPFHSEADGHNPRNYRGNNPLGRPRMLEGTRKNRINIRLLDDELKLLLSVTNAPADFLREAALEAAKATTA